MRSTTYADLLAHRNPVATKELASAVIAWVYRRAALLVVCEIPGGAHFLPADRVWPPYHSLGDDRSRLPVVIATIFDKPHAPRVLAIL